MALVYKDIYIRKITIVFVVLLLFVSRVLGQPMFYSQSLSNLYYSLPEARNIDILVIDTVIVYHNIVANDTVQVAFCFDENGVFEHIGYRFLHSNDTFTENVIVRFIERELLSWFLSSDINQTLVSYRENGLQIFFNNNPVKQSVLQDKQGLLNLLKNYQGISIHFIEGKNYEFSLLFKNEQKISFHFPAESELITGMDKKERDIQLAIQLQNHKVISDSLSTPDYSYLQLLHDTIYIEKGSTFMIPQINNDLFYIKVDSTYQLAFDKSLIAESFSNALLMPLRSNYQVNITHRMYGKTAVNYTVSSHGFDDFFRSDYDWYFGIESLEKEKLKGTLILSNRNYGNIHLAYVSVPLDDLLNDGIMEMQLYSNIPQHNIRTLFGK